MDAVKLLLERASAVRSRIRARLRTNSTPYCAVRCARRTIAACVHGASSLSKERSARGSERCWLKRSRRDCLARRRKCSTVNRRRRFGRRSSLSLQDASNPLRRSPRSSRSFRRERRRTYHAGSTGLGLWRDWRTREPAYDALVKAGLGLKVEDAIIGFIHIGTSAATPRELARPEPHEFVTRWE